MGFRNRIVEHREVRAGDLVPHPLNFREHPEEQKDALRGSLDEVGFARSCLGYRLPDGRIQLIDGHLRAELDPDAMITVEIIDVTEDEARKLLLTLDPLAALAQANADVHRRLKNLVDAESPALSALWEQQQRSARKLAALKRGQQHREKQKNEHSEQFIVMVQCRDEQHQVELLERFQEEGLECKALQG